MKYQWADGFVPPKNVSAAVVKAALDELPEPSPDLMLEASKRKKHCLHEDLWSEGDQAWAQKGRLERVRRIIGAIHEPIIIGGKSITIRSVEFVRPENGEGRWAKLSDIRRDPELLDAYMAEVQRLQDQAAAKLAKVRDLMRQRD